MNTGFDRHYSMERLEEYAMDMLAEEDSNPLEEHLLMCPACQDMLATTDEYIRVAKAAAVLAAGAPRRLSKPMATSATLA